MIVAILDTETSALDPKDGHLLEVAVVRWSVTHATVLEATSTLVQAPENKAREINGIPPDALSFGLHPSAVERWLLQRVEGCDAIVAHNADFDRQWVPDVVRLPWIDTCWDVEWPRLKACGGSSLAAICLGHGLAVLEAHRALTDCLLLARLFERVEDMAATDDDCVVERLLRRAMRPKVKVLSLAPFEQKETVKAHRFRWDPDARVWWRMMPAEDVEGLPFRTRRVS